LENSNQAIDNLAQSLYSESMPKETRTYRDRARYNIMAVTRRRRRLKELAIQSKGGKCMFCNKKANVGILSPLENKEEFVKFVQKDLVSTS